MPTLDEWEQALAAPRQIDVESSPALIAEVQQRHAKKDAALQARRQEIPPRKNRLSGVPCFAPVRQLQIVPAYLLNRLGVVTTPPIENLADLCSTWAYLRYLWAFEIPPPGALTAALRLSDAARRIDFHQKGLLSDQIGVGMAATLLGDYLNAPLAADVTVAMDDSAWPIVLQFDSSPDYLFFNVSQTNIFIVECKGTQASRSAAIEQLRRGTEQVPSLRFTDGRTPPSLVVATCLSRNGTRVFFLDPPDDEEAEGPRTHGRVGQREWRVRNDVAFGRAIRLISEAKMLAFAGAFEMATNKLERARTQQIPAPGNLPPELETAENEFGVFRGLRRQVGLRDRFAIEVFQGLDAAILSAYISEDAAHMSEALGAFRSRTSSGVADATSKLPAPSSRERGSVVVRTTAPDGAYLELRVSPP